MRFDRPTAIPLAALVALTPSISAYCQEASTVDPVDAAIEILEVSLAEFRNGIDDRSWSSLDAAGVGMKLGQLVELDQHLRHWMIEYPTENDFDPAQLEKFRVRVEPYWDELDLTNTSELKTLLAAHGWPVISRFGRKADSDAWILVQHADRDPDFQRETLSLLESLLEKGETDPNNFAGLYDRVAIAEGRAQRYGTQFYCTSAEGGLTVGELEDAANVDALRASVSLPPVDEYLRRAEKAIGEGMAAMCANFARGE